MTFSLTIYILIFYAFQQLSQVYLVNMHAATIINPHVMLKTVSALLALFFTNGNVDLATS